MLPSDFSSGRGDIKVARSVETLWREPGKDGKYWIQSMALGIVVIVALAYLFYRSIFILPMLMLLFIPYKKWRKITWMENKQGRFTLQLRDFLQLLSGNLQAGESIEHAIENTIPELEQQWGKSSFIYRDLQDMTRQMKLSGEVTAVLEQWAEKRGDEELKLFLQVFVYARKTGGNLCEIITRTTDSISRRMDTKKQIESMLAAKRMEQTIMSVVPLGILLYILMTNPEYLSPLYGNLKGILFMSGCLVTYGLAVYWGIYLLKIEV